MITSLHLLATLALPAPFQGSITKLSWSPDGRHLAVAGTTGSVAVWDVARGTCASVYQVGRDAVTALAWTRGGRCLLLGNASGALSLIELVSGKKLVSFCFDAAITRLSCAPNEEDDRFLVVAGSHLQVFTPASPHPLTRRYATPVLDAAWCPAGRSIALITAQGLVEVWDVAGRRTRVQVVLATKPRCLAWGATDQVLTVGTACGQIQEYSLRADVWQDPRQVALTPLAALLCGPSSMVVRSSKGTLLWREPEEAHLLGPTQAIALDPAGARLATALARVVTLSALAVS